MPTYIEREALLEEIEDRIANIGFTSPYQDDITLMLEGMARVKDSVEDFPTADVVERKRGRWLEGYLIHKYGCSCCGKRQDRISPYCPNCGADMREVDHATD